MAHSAGDRVTLTLKEHYVEGGGSHSPGKVVYAPDSDRMKAHYEYYVFDEAEYVAVLGARDAAGRVSFTVAAVADSVNKLSDPSLPQPNGGFKRTYFRCEGLAKADGGAEAGDEDM